MTNELREKGRKVSKNIKKCLRFHEIERKWKWISIRFRDFCRYFFELLKIMNFIRSLFFRTVRFVSNARFMTILVLAIISIGICLNDFRLQAQTLRRDASVGTVQKEKYVSMVLMPEGIRILKVNYPCDRHPNTSVEVRLLSENAARDLQFVNPIFFEHAWMLKKDLNGVSVKDMLDQCYWMDEDDHVVRRLRFEDPEADVDILGAVGAFQVRDTMVRNKTENPKTREMETTLIFPNASRVQVGAMPSKADPFSEYAFGFDLVAPEFNQPCDIMVWVLRGDKIMAEETLHWDGRIEKPYEEKEFVVRARKKVKKEKDDFFDDEEGDEDSGDEEEFEDDEDSGDDEEFEDDEDSGDDEEFEDDEDSGDDEEFEDDEDSGDEEEFEDDEDSGNEEEFEDE